MREISLLAVGCCSFQGQVPTLPINVTSLCVRATAVEFQLNQPARSLINAVLCVYVCVSVLVCVITDSTDSQIRTGLSTMVPGWESGSVSTLIETNGTSYAFP